MRCNLDLPFLGKLSILRILRVLRPFKSNALSVVAGLQIVVNTIVDSVPDMVNMVILLLVLMYIYSIIGVALFADVVPSAFADIGKTMFTLFITFTQIGWVEILDQLELKGYFVEGSIFFLSFYSVGVFIFMKTVVAVVVANLEEVYQTQKEIGKLRKRKLKSENKTGRCI